ncbi:MAG: hypothetical protein NUV67_00885 [archaeon]|nr:hypothetical protein [archaeon]
MLAFKLFVKGLYFGLLMFILIFIGDFFFPGKLAGTVFSPLGILIIFVVFMIDAVWLFSPVETEKPKIKKGALP